MSRLSESLVLLVLSCYLLVDHAHVILSSIHGTFWLGSILIELIYFEAKFVQLAYI